MVNKKRAIIYGRGNIGSEIFYQAQKEGYEVAAMVTRRHVAAANTNLSTEFDHLAKQQELLAAADKVCGDPDIVFLAIPSGGSGEDELATMLHYLKRDIPVVTAGKAALSQHFDKLQPYLSRLGFNASVGGGVKVLNELRERLRVDNGEHSIVQMVINGTIMYALNQRHGGRSKNRIAREATKLGYAEPRVGGGYPSWQEMFMGEFPDIAKKCAIVLNAVYYPRTNRIFTPNDIKQLPIEAADLDRFSGTTARYAYVVNISTNGEALEIDDRQPGSMWLRHGGINQPEHLRLYAGFHAFPSDGPLASWVPRMGPGNGLHIDQSGTQFVCSGDGAGDLATVDTVMFDARRLCLPHD